MTFSEKVTLILKNKNLKVTDLSIKTGIPASTLYSFINRDSSRMKVKHVIDIAKALDVSADYLATDEIMDPNYGKYELNELAQQEQTHIKKYRAVDDHGRRTIDTVTEYEYERCYPSNGKVVPFEEKSIEFPVQYEVAAAGFGNYLSDQGFELVPLKVSSIPLKAKYGIRISGESMQPDYLTGDIIFIEPMPAIQSGELGLFSLDGECLFKKLIVDHDKKVIILRSLNADYDDRVIKHGENLHTYGRVVGMIRE